MSNLIIRTIDPTENLFRVTELLLQLNPERGKKYIEQILAQMSVSTNYKCFALYENSKIIGVCSGWVSIRIYCGKQLELDNVIVDKDVQSKGLGSIFFEKIEEWALERDFQSISLNTYVSNSRSHKFYFNQGCSILGFHFQKLIK